MASQILPGPGGLSLHAVGPDNWRGVARLEVTEAQRAFVADAGYYLALCCYGDSGWQPLAVQQAERVTGFLMWASDPADGSCWLGGIIIDRRLQGRGYGAKAVRLAVSKLSAEHGYQRFALSYLPENGVARRLYARLGFVETGEREGDEVVARLSLPG